MGGAAYQTTANQALSTLMDRPIKEWESSQIAWALDCLGCAGMPEEHVFIQSMLFELAGRQEESGAWSSEDGPAYAVSATISSLKAFKRFGWIDSLD
jgi:hypothetical protein